MELSTQTCPTCQALPGEPCISTQGRPLTRIHPLRHRTIDALTGRISRPQKDGYVDVYVGKDYPIGRDIWIGRHRVVLYEHLRMPGISACHVCQWILPWKLEGTEFTGNEITKRQVVVDHLNGRPGDDDPSNLRPACASCNSNRQWMSEVAPIRWEEFKRTFAAVPPWERPTGVDWLSDVANVNAKMIRDLRTAVFIACKEEGLNYYDIWEPEAPLY